MSQSKENISEKRAEYKAGTHSYVRDNLGKDFIYSDGSWSRQKA